VSKKNAGANKHCFAVFVFLVKSRVPSVASGETSNACNT